MRLLFLLIVPLALVSWKPQQTPRTTILEKPNQLKSGDTLKLDSLIFSDFFSPNGDGENDTFYILNLETLENYGSNSLKVFNRWGEVVYTASPYANDWDGSTNQGGALMDKKVTDGVYFFEFYNGKGIIATGKITIKR